MVCGRRRPLAEHWSDKIPLTFALDDRESAFVVPDDFRLCGGNYPSDIAIVFDVVCDKKGQRNSRGHQCTTRGRQDMPSEGSNPLIMPGNSGQ